MQSVCVQMTRERLLGGTPLGTELTAMARRDDNALTPCSFKSNGGLEVVPSVEGACHGWPYPQRQQGSSMT